MAFRSAGALVRASDPRRGLIDVAARLARHGHGHNTVHLPEGWHREHEWMAHSRETIRGIYAVDRG